VEFGTVIEKDGTLRFAMMLLGSRDHIDTGVEK
jgi:hypothetical protein